MASVLALTMSSTMSLLGTACRDGQPTEPDAARSAGEGQGEAKAGEPASDPDETPPSDRPAPVDPERADKLADLDALCAAVDHDYKDGTLGDYYAKVELRTDWGRAQRDAGNESIQPARLLEKAVAALDPKGEEPALGHCRTLLDYIDDVE